nr:hypothetical protein [Tanacetum cinerariifolium]
MLTQQDIYTAGSESRPPMLNKENYVPWSSHLLRYAKSRPNGKLIHNSILNGPYVRKRIPEPGDANCDITVTETFHLQTDDKLSDKELKQIEADDQAIKTILLGLLEDIYAAVDSCETTQEIWLRPEWSRHVTIVHQTKDLHTADYTQLYNFLKYNQKEVDIIDPTTAMNMALALMAKAFKLNYSTPTNNNQRISSNPRNRHIAQPGKNTGNKYGYNDVIGNQNQIRNGNLVAARAEGNTVGQNGNQIRCYNCKGEEARIQLQAEEYDLTAAAADLDEIKEVNANCILMAKLQQASTLGTQTNSAPVYDTDGSAEVHRNCDDNEIFNMFTQEEQYTKLLEPIPESHQVPQNDNDVISEDTSVEQEETLQLAQESRDKMKQMNKEIKPANYTKINHLSGVFVPQTALSREELYFSNNFKMANISKSFLIPNEDLSDDTTPSIARKFLNKEATKFVGDFKSLANEADASLAKHKALELEIEHLQTELERTKERFENCIIKKETEYAKLWNDWYKKYDECKYDKISYDKAYKDMQQKIERLQVKLGDLKGKSKDTSCVTPPKMCVAAEYCPGTLLHNITALVKSFKATQRDLI